MKKPEKGISDYCRLQLQGIKDTQDLLNGKWKTVIVTALYYNEKIRFMELVRNIEGIAPKVLSKELRDLEINQLVKRTVSDTMPVTVQYELTSHGKSLYKIIEAMAEWGIYYRNAVFRA